MPAAQEAVLDQATTELYLHRLGLAEPPPHGADGLALLMERHLRSVPFENLSIHLGEPILLDEPALVDKIVRHGRGGFCYELNGAFALLLQALGYDVTLLSARVFGEGGRLGPPYDHLTLRVDLDEPWLVDVGFGRFIGRPVVLGGDEPQQDPAGEVTFTEAPYGDLDVHLAGVPQFRIDLRPRELGEFAATCWYQQTNPAAHFTRSLTCSLPTDHGRVTLSDRLLIRTVDGVRTETLLESDADVLAAYRHDFGIVLDRLPTPPA